MAPKAPGVPFSFCSFAPPPLSCSLTELQAWSPSSPYGLRVSTPATASLFLGKPPLL